MGERAFGSGGSGSEGQPGAPARALGPSSTGALLRWVAVLERTAGQVRGSVLREASYTLVWRWLALVSILFALDLLFALPVWLRWLGLLAQVGLVGWCGRGILRQRARLRVEAERAARVVEERHPELDNALINAVQFDRLVDSAPPEPAGLMRRAIRSAERAVDALPPGDVVDRAGEQRSRRRAAGFIAGWVLLALVFPAGVFAVLPRIFAPWMDDLTPPFSFTRFELRPAGATVRWGASLTVQVTVSGPVPEDVALMTRTAQGSSAGEWRRIPLESRGPGGYTVTLDSLREDTWYFAQGGGARSPRYLARVLLPPGVRSLRASYRYPAYTGRAPRTEPVGEAGVHGLLNTHVQLEITANRRLGSGDLRIRTEEGGRESLSVRVDPRDPTRAEASFVLTGSGEFRIGLTSEEGQANPEAARGKITLERDQRPVVWIRHPGEDLLVTPDMRVPIAIEAEDDVGVRSLELHRVVNDLGDSPQSFPPGAPAPRKRESTLMDLADLGVRPGDQITYYATAYDNDPGRPNFAETEAYHLKVVTPEEYQEALKEQRTPQDLAAQAKDLVRALRDLAGRQRELAQRMAELQKQLAKHPGDPALQKQLQAAREQEKALQQEARELAEQLKEFARSPSLSDVEKAIKEEMAAMAARLEKTAGGAMQGAQSGEPGQAARNADQAARELEQLSRQGEQRVQRAIEHMEKLLPLYNDLERFMALVDLQGQLVLRARQFQERSSASAEDRSRLEHLATEQERIRVELEQLQEDLRRHADDARKDFPKAAASAVRIADEIGQRKIPGLMGSAQSAFGRMNGPEGFRQAQRALQEMEAMVKECQDSEGNAEGELDLALSRCLGKSGLGRSLSQSLGGLRGTGMGSGPGGMFGGRSGSAGGGTTTRGPKAYQPGTTRMSGGGGVNRNRSRQRAPGEPAELAPEDVEVISIPARKPPRAEDAGSGRYPPEYRKMVSDYFKSVAEQR